MTDITTDEGDELIAFYLPDPPVQTNKATIGQLFLDAKEAGFTSKQAAFMVYMKILGMSYGGYKLESFELLAEQVYSDAPIDPKG